MLRNAALSILILQEIYNEIVGLHIFSLLRKYARIQIK